MLLICDMVLPRMLQRLPFRLMNCSWQFRATFCLLSLLFAISTQAPSACAAEKLVVTYGPLNAAVSIKDLETLVNTGDVPGSLRFYLNLAGLDPAMLRNLLSMELGASRDFMTGMLASDSGEQLLAQMSQVVHLPPNRPEIQVLKSAEQNYTQPSEAENIAALRTALTKAADDRRVTVLEVLQAYPTEKVYLNAVRLIRFANSLQSEGTQSGQ
jgi:hypothetical protein